jgi:hypothetical protein
MAEVQDSELGRSKQSVSPREHLKHLLKIGWEPQAPLIQKYIRENGLERVLDEVLKELQGQPS